LHHPVESGSHRRLGLPETALDFLIALALNLIFVALIAVLLWPLGKAMLALRLAKGYGIFWILTAITAVAVSQIQRFFRVDAYRHVDAYVVSNLSHGVFLLAGWSAFAVVTVRSFVAPAPLWVTAILWLVGIFSSVIAFTVITSFYRGGVYRVMNISLAIISFAVFALWPASGRAIFGWFFDLF
jgi:hypothetical protein